MQAPVCARRRCCKTAADDRAGGPAPFYRGTVMSEEKPKPPPAEENLSLYGAVSSIFYFIEGDPNVVVGMDISKLESFYRDRVGVPIHLGAWPEIERTILFRINEVKPLLKKKGKPIQVRIIGPVQAWLGMRLYKLVYPHADQVFYTEGEAIVDI